MQHVFRSKPNISIINHVEINTHVDRHVELLFTNKVTISNKHHEHFQCSIDFLVLIPIDWWCCEKPHANIYIK